VPLKTLRYNGHEIDLLEYRESLLKWGDEHFRHFSWRDTPDAYHLLLAELLLIRTQADRAEDVYETLVERFPTPTDLAGASLDDIEKLIEPLGLAKRASFLKEMAVELVDRFDSEVPDAYERLQSLPGVGKYVAAAVCCFAFGDNVPLVDANTLRVVGRTFGIDQAERTYRNTELRTLIGRMATDKRPGRYYYAMLDLAATVCYSGRTPECDRCPLSKWCQRGRQHLARS